jgi:hypothetical protein
VVFCSQVLRTLSSRPSDSPTHKHPASLSLFIVGLFTVPYIEHSVCVKPSITATRCCRSAWWPAAGCGCAVRSPRWYCGRRHDASGPSHHDDKTPNSSAPGIRCTPPNPPAAQSTPEERRGEGTEREKNVCEWRGENKRKREGEDREGVQKGSEREKS